MEPAQGCLNTRYGRTVEGKAALFFQSGGIDVKLKNIFLVKHQSCWTCEIEFTETTATQATDVHDSAEAEGKRWWSALFRGLRAARKVSRGIRARPGEREKKGWA